VNYEPTPNPDAILVNMPAIDPSADLEPPLALPDGLNWERSKPIAFVGEVKAPDERTTGTVVRIEISPVRTDGSRAKSKSKQVTAKCERGADVISYRIDWKAPKEPGRYHVVIKSIGPSVDLTNLDTFVEGVVEVR
jgi:hypothetical protein